jgi:GAF domain-containing protein/HAMP domain-containing protein
MSVWKPLTVHEPDEHHPEGQVWAVMTEIDESEALGPVNQLASGLGLLIGLAALAIGALAVFMGTRFALGFVNPILNLTETATQVAAGDLSRRSDVKSADELGQLSDTFNTMTAQLQETLGGLEERVAARTKDLATVAEISTITSTIRDPEEMLSNMVHLTQRGFNRYHAHVFTYHKDTDSLEIVACGWKEDSEHEGTHGTEAIPLSAEQSLVARAARTRRPVIVNDVRNEPGWLPNPQLPDTRAEMAVPMIVGDELLGVLDVQEDSVDGFTEEDANIKMTLASQVATALQNAQAYTRAQKQAELESMVNLIGQRIQRTTTIEDTLQTAIRELGKAIGASRVKASLRSASATVETTPIEPAEPVLAVEGERNNGSSDSENTLAG